MIVFVRPDRTDSQGAEERKRSKIGFGKLPDTLPVAPSKNKVLDLLGMRRKQCHGGDRNVLIDRYLQQ